MVRVGQLSRHVPELSLSSGPRPTIDLGPTVGLALGFRTVDLVPTIYSVGPRVLGNLGTRIHQLATIM